MTLRQPALHDLDLCVRAPTVVVSDSTGQLRPAPGHGVLHADVRVLSRAELSLERSDLLHVRAVRTGTGASRYVSLARGLDDAGPDPTVRIQRHRTAAADGMVEHIELVSTSDSPVWTKVSLLLAADLASMSVVKHGGAAVPVPFALDSGSLTWSDTDITVAAIGVDADAALTEDGGRLDWQVRLAPRGSTVLEWRLRVHDSGAVITTPAHGLSWHEPVLTATDHRLESLVAQSLDDLAALRMATTKEPSETFLGAGAPWFLTLFGRDSLWAARLLLPLGTELAASTLRTLAGFQGVEHDENSAQAPGKIMHELRRTDFLEPNSGTRLPAAYYGTVDATLLWVCLLHDAWRWGMPCAEVAELIPAAEAALGWLLRDADPDGDGFVEYRDESGHGLANQGWKDSGDAVRFRDGRLAEAPIALCEVQGYAYEAAVKGAALLSAFDRGDGERWLSYAHELAERFRARFWVADEHGPYPAIALDRAKRPVDALASNVGHLLGTGLLNDEENGVIAARLTAPDMSSGFGLRTMSAGTAGYSPLSYHCGTVWPHDTVIVAAGLRAAGRPEAAAELVAGLLRAAPAFDYRLPELYGGDALADIAAPVPYPAACRPQAWAAAAGIGIVGVLTGITPDVPGAAVHVDPLPGSPVGALSVRGLRLGADTLDLGVAADGRVEHISAPQTLTVHLPDRR